MKQYSLSESLAKQAVVYSAATGLWLANKFIRTQKIISKYPTPKSLKLKLQSSNKTDLIVLSKELTDDMTPKQYRIWVYKRINPKMGIGKAVITFLFPITTVGVQTAKALYHGAEDSDDILKRAYNKKRLSRN